MYKRQYLDDLILVPLGIALAIKMIPPPVLAECRQQAQALMAEGRPVNWAVTIVIIAIWLLLAAVAILVVVGAIQGN